MVGETGVSICSGGGVMFGSVAGCCCGCSVWVGGVCCCGVSEGAMECRYAVVLLGLLAAFLGCVESDRRTVLLDE
eukprot:12924460-Prorocentrum_lima.AAC.1